MISVTDLDTEFLQLRPFGPEDHDYLVALHEQQRVTTMDDVETFQSGDDLHVHLRDLLNAQMTGWVVYHEGSECRVGAFYVTNLLSGVGALINPVSDIPALKDLVPVDAMGRRLKIMDEAALVVMPYLFERFNLQRIGGAFYSTNVPGIRFCQRIGMRAEGIIRHGSRVNGQPVDVHLFGLLKSEVSALCPQ